MPAFARMRHVTAGGAVRSTGGAYLRLLRSLGLLLVPVSCAMTLMAEPLVTLIMGPNWSASAPIIRLMVWAGLEVALTNVTNGVFVGVGRPELPMWISLGRAVTMLALMIHFRDKGPAGIALGVMISALAAMSCSILLAIRIHGLNVREVVRSTRLILLAASPVILVYAAFGKTMPAVAALGVLAALAISGLLLFRLLSKELSAGKRMVGDNHGVGVSDE